VAGSIAALCNDLGVVGSAPDVGLLIGKVLSDQDGGDTASLIAGVEWAVDEGAHVINLSLGLDATEEDTALLETCDAAYGAGVLLVAAAGNTGGAIPQPASYASVVAVSNIDRSCSLHFESSYGGKIEFAAPGTDVLSTVPAGTGAGASVDSGTSK
ncbi:MAG: S8 family serine peptidase, partial [Phycisphaerae bacterium]|nr:S8 family serine peptidase [Phycisphaerae bacterium]